MRRGGVNATRLEALGLPRKGEVYDLSSGWWRGMPGHSAHPSFDVVTYRTPRGIRNEGDRELVDPDDNDPNFGFVSELVMGTTHTGTHIDALCHVTCGEDEWHGGGRADDLLGDFGAASGDARELAPIIAPGLMLDVPAALGLEAMGPGAPIGPRELEAACARARATVTRGSVVLLRTGFMKNWPDEERMAKARGAGLSLEGSEWLLERGVAAIGADTPSLEVSPSGVPGNQHPVHLLVLQKHGIPILEWVHLEELAWDAVHEFLFIALPLGITGATGSMLSPVAVT